MAQTALPDSIEQISVDDALRFWQAVACKFDTLDRKITEKTGGDLNDADADMLHDYKQAQLANEFARKYLDSVLDAVGQYHALIALHRIGFISPEAMHILI